MDTERLHEIAEQAAQEWEHRSADTYETGFLAGVHQALTYARTGGTDIGPELDDLIERAALRTRKAVPHSELPDLVNWWLCMDGEWQKIVAARTTGDETQVQTDRDRGVVSGQVAVMSPLVMNGAE